MTAAAGEARSPSSATADQRAEAGDGAGESAAWRRAFEGIARGEESALAALYDLAARPIFGLALWRTGSIDEASDVVQEVFVRVAAERERLARVENPRAWLLGLAHHAAVDITRRRTRRAEESLEAAPLLAAPAGEHELQLDAERASRLVQRLPPGQRDAVYLRHFEELSFAEIGRITGVPLFTAASRYRLGMRKLRRLMDGEP